MPFTAFLDKFIYILTPVNGMEPYGIRCINFMLPVLLGADYYKVVCVRARMWKCMTLWAWNQNVNQTLIYGTMKNQFPFFPWNFVLLAVPLNAHVQHTRTNLQNNECKFSIRIVFTYTPGSTRWFISWITGFRLRASWVRGKLWRLRAPRVTKAVCVKNENRLLICAVIYAICYSQISGVYRFPSLS